MAELLFKFSSAEGAAKVLEHNSIFITSPLDLNDPFEMRPAWTQTHADRRYEEEKARSAVLAKIPICAAIEGGPLNQVQVSNIGDPGPQMQVEHQYGIADHYNGRVFDLLHSRYRVLSLVRGLLDGARDRPDSDDKSILLWSHYGDQFQGVALGLDPDNLHNGVIPGGLPVNYSPDRQSLPPPEYDTWFRLTGQQPPPGHVIDSESGLLLTKVQHADAQRKRVLRLLSHKAPVWSYEQEVRMVYDLREFKPGHKAYRPVTKRCEKCASSDGKSRRCRNDTFRDAIHLPPAAVRAVLFGTDCLPSRAKAILDLLAKPCYEHVNLYWSAIPSSRYHVQYAEGSAEYIHQLQDHRAAQIAQAKGHVKYTAARPNCREAAKGTNYRRRTPKGLKH